MKKLTYLICCAAISMAAVSISPCVVPSAMAQADNWAADDDALEARKIERYQQIVDQSPEKSYAFNQLMNTVGKGTEYQKLLATYEKKVASKPQNFNLRMVLGHMYQYGGRTADAIESYKKALEIKKTPLVLMSIGASEAENRNFEQAVANYEAAASMNPTRDQKQEIWRALAEIAIYRRDLDRAKVYFAELIKLEPNSLFVRRELSQIYAQNRLYDEARQVLAEGQKLSSISASDKEQIELDIAQLYEQEGNDDEALKRYQTLSGKLPSSHWMQREIITHIIDIQRRQGNIADLANSLEKSWKSPTYTQRIELADLYDESQQPEKALDHLKKAIAQSPKLPEAREKLVQFYRSHGQISEMIEAKKALIKAIPDNASYRFELYDIYLQQKQPDNAMAVLDEMAKSFASDFDVLHQVAEDYQLNGRHQKAQAIYENWIKKHPQDLDCLEALGDFYDNSGDKKKALTTWQKIEKLPVDQATKLETLARIYDEHGYADEAEALYAKSVAASPKDCQVRSEYADILTRNRKQDKAVEAWKTLAMTCANPATRTLAARQIAGIYQARGNEVRGLAQFRGECESKPDDQNMVLLFARLAESLQKPSYAIPILQSYIERHPQEVEVIRALSSLQSLSGDFKSARETLVSLNQSNDVVRYEALVAMAEMEEQEGEFESAQQHYTEALKLNASDPDLHERLGDLLVKRRMYEDASHHYESAFMMDNRNYEIAFKNATCLSIQGKDKEADALYDQIVSGASDEALMLKAAQRAMEDHAWHGTLNELAKGWMPLVRSKQHRTLYLEILMMLAEIQAQPHILSMRTRDTQHLYTARYELKALSEQYASVLVESLLSEDSALSARALALSEWLASAGVVQILGQKIEKAETSETGRLMQLDAIRAIAHAQLPASVPVLKNCLEPQYSRALREQAIWALGLIQSPAAIGELVKALDLNLDSFRAIAIIGLGRQGAHLEEIRKKLNEDPSQIVKDAAAWALAHNRDTKSKSEIERLYEQRDLKPHQLWALVQAGGESASNRLLENLWCSQNAESRAMAARLMRSDLSGQPLNLTMITQPEAQGSIVEGKSTHYLSNFNIDKLLDHFADLETSQYAGNSPAHWMADHRETFVSAVSDVARGKYSGEDEHCKIQMMRDMVFKGQISGIDAKDEAQRPILLEAATKIDPYLQTWADSPGELSELSLRMFSLVQSPKSMQRMVDMANSELPLSRRVLAVDTIASYQTSESQAALRKLAQNDHYLIRASALQYLDPNNADDKKILEKAQSDDFRIVSETAKKRLKMQ